MRDPGLWNLKQSQLWRTLEVLGHPQDRLRLIHIVGTNGKGSTGASLAALLRLMSDRPVGHFSSPHVLSYNERIRLDGVPVSDEVIASANARIDAAREATGEPEPTFFGRSLLQALLAFEGCEWVIIEAGIGGREDVTNLFHPEMVIITTIALDHAQCLGGSLRSIAAHKADVIEPGGQVISAAQCPEVMAEIRRTTRKRGAALSVYDPAQVSDVRLSSRDTMWQWRCGDIQASLCTPLIGRHQVENTMLAVMAARRLGLTEMTRVNAALGGVQWIGRMQHLFGMPDIWLDGAHNDQAIVRLLENMRALGIEKPILVFGMHDGKISEKRRDELFAAAASVISVEVQGRSDAQIEVSVQGALDEIAERMKSAEKKETVLICGSLYILGPALKWHVAQSA